MGGAPLTRVVASPPSGGSFHSLVSGPESVAFRLAGSARVDGRAVVLGDPRLHSAVWCAQKVAVRGGFKSAFHVSVNAPRGDVRWQWEGPHEVKEIEPPARIRFVLTQASVFDLSATGCCEVDTSDGVVAGRVCKKRKRVPSREGVAGDGAAAEADVAPAPPSTMRPHGAGGGSYVFVEIAYCCAASYVVVGIVDASGVRSLGRSSCALPCLSSVHIVVEYEGGRLRVGTADGPVFEVPVDLSQCGRAIRIWLSWLGRPIRHMQTAVCNVTACIRVCILRKGDPIRHAQTAMRHVPAHAQVPRPARRRRARVGVHPVPRARDQVCGVRLEFRGRGWGAERSRDVLRVQPERGAAAGGGSGGRVRGRCGAGRN